MAFTILNFNAYRAADEKRFKHFRDLITLHKPMICTIQEIHIGKAVRFFGKDFNVLVNIEQSSRDQIGICTMVHRSLRVEDFIIGDNGRIIGVRIGSIKLFNLYPKSGTQNRMAREQFFNEDLPNLIKVWGGSKKESLIFAGDFNCIHRKEDTLNNPEAHLQPALLRFMKTYQLSDDFLGLMGSATRVYSRITTRSSTRIDFILSNSSDQCKRFEYIDFPLLDHKVIVAQYSITISTLRERIPREKFVSNWVINRDLQNDLIFNDMMERVFEQIKLEKDRSQGFFDPSFIWFKVKETIVDFAKYRTLDMRKRRKQVYMRIMDFYMMAKEDLANGIDCGSELKRIINDLNAFYREENAKKVRDAKYLEIKDHVFDIVKAQKEKKYVNGSNIDKIRVDGVVYDSDSAMVDAVENKMRKELAKFPKDDWSRGPDEKDLAFLDLLPKLEMEADELQEIERNITMHEVELVLGEVDLDSSPGLDGITYRFIKHFFNNSNFQELYLGFLNHVKCSGDFGPVGNVGVMILKNKKGNSVEYEKKRKITKLNKDSNLLGKIWSNRLRDIILGKIVPDSQFVCSKRWNIVDELRHLRDVNLHLLENGENGSILSLDYANAFRSVSLRWFDLVMKKIGFPQGFVDWFWNMFKNIGIKISINRYGSSVIKNERGFLEGCPPSMAAWVVSSMALIIAIEKKVKGIQLKDGRVFKSRNFADDQKIFLREVNEIESVEAVVTDFEKVSGVRLHRDKTLKKCNVLPFGSHLTHDCWPYWVNVCTEMKVIGGTFVNNGSLESINSKQVKIKFYGKLNENWGMHGTLGQRVYFVNTFCLTKLNYLAQVFKIDKKVLKEVQMRCLQFIYSGFNERPVQILNYRRREDGGLGLVHPELKAKSLIVHNMWREYREREVRVAGNKLDQHIYGYEELLVQFLGELESKMGAKDIYIKLLFSLCRNGTSLIPTRIERRIMGVKWTRTYKNIRNLTHVTPKEKEFAIMLTQDILPVRGRLHRKNADKRCSRKVQNSICDNIQDRVHYFITCSAMTNSFEMLKEILNNYLGKRFTNSEILHLSF